MFFFQFHFLLCYAVFIYSSKIIFLIYIILQAEALASEVSGRLAEAERARSELADRIAKLTAEADSVTSQLEEAELRASTAIKSAATMETQFTEAQVYFFF